jgi:hypothetical protein
MLRIVWKCRLCGRTFTDEATAMDVEGLSEGDVKLFDRMRDLAERQDLAVHDCPTHAPQFGLADPVGAKNF